jgi:hypothetical protein
MSTTAMTELHRISFTLDSGLVLERLILKRLAGLKRKRSHDWLRSLLVQGFLTEGRWLRTELKSGDDGAAPQAAGIPATPFATWLRRSDRPLARGARPATAPLADDNARAAQSDAGEKPFARLRTVIG